MSPSHARKGGIKYRYYLSSALLQGQPERAGSVRRVPAAEIETLVIRSVREHLKLSEPIDDRSLVDTHVARVEVQPDQLVIQLAHADRNQSQGCKSSQDALVSPGTRHHQRGAVRFFCPAGSAAQTRSSDPLRDPRHLGRIDRARTPLARRTDRRRNRNRGEHREARELQRPQGQHDDLARLPRARSRQSRHRGAAASWHGRRPPLRPAGRMVSPAPDARLSCLTARIRTGLCPRQSLFPGNGILRPETKAPK